MVPLDQHFTVFDSTAGATMILQLFGQSFQVIDLAYKPFDNGHHFPGPMPRFQQNAKLLRTSRQGRHFCRRLL